MKERPIIFNAPMVRAILEGRKAQTRRVINPQPPEDYSKDMIHGPEMYHPAIEDKDGNLDAGPEIFGVYDEYGEWGVKCPYGQPSDRLWVREMWCKPSNDLKTKDRFNHPAYLYPVLYASDEGKQFFPLGGNWSQRNSEYKWHPSIYMPRWASRITLEIVNVRAERAQDINYEDAIAEGWSAEKAKCAPYHWYRKFWDEINGPGAWDKNPWVWVIEFKRGGTL